MASSYQIHKRPKDDVTDDEEKKEIEKYITKEDKVKTKPIFDLRKRFLKEILDWKNDKKNKLNVSFKNLKQWSYSVKTRKSWNGKDTKDIQSYHLNGPIDKVMLHGGNLYIGDYCIKYNSLSINNHSIGFNTKQICGILYFGKNRLKFRGDIKLNNKEQYDIIGTKVVQYNITMNDNDNKKCPMQYGYIFEDETKCKSHYKFVFNFDDENIDEQFCDQFVRNGNLNFYVKQKEKEEKEEKKEEKEEKKEEKSDDNKEEQKYNSNGQNETVTHSRKYGIFTSDLNGLHGVISNRKKTNEINKTKSISFIGKLDKTKNFGEVPPTKILESKPLPTSIDSAHNLDNLKNIKLDTDKIMQIQIKTQQLFGTNMQSQMTQSDLKTYYQQSVVPSPDDPIVNQPDQSTMYKAYAIGAISEGVNNYIDYLDIENKRKLAYYQNVQVMKDHPTFVTEMQRLYGVSFALLDEDIKWYRENNPSYWGQQLYDTYLSKEDTINKMVGQILEGSYDDINRYGVILQALGRNDLSAEFQKYVFFQYNLVCALTQISKSADEATYFFEKALYGILNQPQTDDPDLKTAIGMMIQEEKAKGAENKAKAIGGIAAKCGSLSASIKWANGMATAGGAFGSLILKNYPKTKAFLGSSKTLRLGNVCFIFAASLAMYSAVTGGQRFDLLSPTGQAAYITLMATLGLNFFVYTPKITITAIESLIAKCTKQVGDVAPEVMDIEMDVLSSTTFGTFTTVTQTGTASVASSGQRAGCTKLWDTFGDRWPKIEKFFKIGKTIMRGLTIATAGVFAVLNTIDFVNAVNAHEKTWQLALLGTSMAAGILEFAALGTMAVVGEGAAVAGLVSICAVAAPALAVVGLIATILYVCLTPKPDPEKPLKDYLDNVFKPTVTNLVIPKNYIGNEVRSALDDYAEKETTSTIAQKVKKIYKAMTTSLSTTHAQYECYILLEQTQISDDQPLSQQFKHVIIDEVDTKNDGQITATYTTLTNDTVKSVATGLTLETVTGTQSLKIVQISWTSNIMICQLINNQLILTEPSSLSDAGYKQKKLPFSSTDASTKYDIDIFQNYQQYGVLSHDLLIYSDLDNKSTDNTLNYGIYKQDTANHAGNLIFDSLGPIINMPKAQNILFCVAEGGTNGRYLIWSNADEKTGINQKIFVSPLSRQKTLTSYTWNVKVYKTSSNDPTKVIYTGANYGDDVLQIESDENLNNFTIKYRSDNTQPWLSKELPPSDVPNKVPVQNGLIKITINQILDPPTPGQKAIPFFPQKAELYLVVNAADINTGYIQHNTSDQTYLGAQLSLSVQPSIGNLMIDKNIKTTALDLSTKDAIVTEICTSYTVYVKTSKIYRTALIWKMQNLSTKATVFCGGIFTSLSSDSSPFLGQLGPWGALSITNAIGFGYGNSFGRYIDTDGTLNIMDN